MASIDMRVVVKNKIVFLKKELVTIKQRKEEISDEMARKGIVNESMAILGALDEEKESMYELLIKHYEEMIFLLENVANLPNGDRFSISP